VDLAGIYFAAKEIDARLDALLDIEAQIVSGLPAAPRLYAGG
jgi:hypothetical protein